MFCTSPRTFVEVPMGFPHLLVYHFKRSGSLHKLSPNIFRLLPRLFKDPLCNSPQEPSLAMGALILCIVFLDEKAFIFSEEVQCLVLPYNFSQAPSGFPPSSLLFSTLVTSSNSRHIPSTFFQDSSRIFCNTPWEPSIVIGGLILYFASLDEKAFVPSYEERHACNQLGMLQKGS
jgi:hypothetical protein